MTKNQVGSTRKEETMKGVKKVQMATDTAAMLSGSAA
jgi:hypothetical protein